MTGSQIQNVGTYSVSVKSFFTSWKEKGERERKPIEIEKKRKKTLKPILHTIFEKCSNLTDDNFWKSIFMDCARGKFPRGFTFKNNLITFRKGNKMTRLEITNSPSQALMASMNFFSTLGGIVSDLDRKRMKREEEEKLLEGIDLNEVTWKDIKSEKMKDILICEFIETISVRLNFTEKERREITTTIKKGFMLKYFTSSNIEMENGRIKEIDGLIINEDTRECEIDPSYVLKFPSRQYTGSGIEKIKIKPEVDFLEIWGKYLTALENKRNKKVTNYSTSQSHIQNDDESEESEVSNLSFTY